jgi:proline dehydrogenase
MGYDRTLLLHLATSRRLERGVKAVPGGEAAAWRAASRYVAGRTELQALQTAEALLDAGHAVSVDLFGERIDDPATADDRLETIARVLSPGRRIQVGAEDAADGRKLAQTRRCPQQLAA